MLERSLKVKWNTLCWTDYLWGGIPPDIRLHYLFSFFVSAIEQVQSVIVSGLKRICFIADMTLYIPLSKESSFLISKQVSVLIDCTGILLGRMIAACLLQISGTYAFCWLRQFSVINCNSYIYLIWFQVYDISDIMTFLMYTVEHSFH